MAKPPRTPTRPSEQTSAGDTSASEDQSAIVSTLADHPTLNGLVQKFVERLPRRLEELRAAFRSSDFEALANHAHGLRGAGGTYGFKPLTEAAGHLERRVREGAPRKEIDAAFARLCDVCRRVSE